MSKIVRDHVTQNGAQILKLTNRFVSINLVSHFWPTEHKPIDGMIEQTTYFFILLCVLACRPAFDGTGNVTGICPWKYSRAPTPVGRGPLVDRSDRNALVHGRTRSGFTGRLRALLRLRATACRLDSSGTTRGSPRTNPSRVRVF